MTASTRSEGRPPLRIGTRGSALALVQARAVAAALTATGTPAELVTIVTEGDRRAPDTAWGEGAFVRGIESALLDGRVDVAVHSAKDVPTDEDARLAIAAYLPREDPRDVLVAPTGTALAGVEDLPRGARVGTDSPRRTAFLRSLRPDLEVIPLHGNVDTRLRRLDEGQADVLVLAAAGLRRLGREDRITVALDPDEVPSAPGQGALAVQVRRDDDVAAAAVARLDDGPTRIAVEAERALLAGTGGGCRAPIGALATVDGDVLRLVAGSARPDGAVRAAAVAEGPAVARELVVEEALAALADAAAGEALRTGAPRVLVTRAAHQAAATMLALVDRGFAPLLVPAIAIVEAGGDALVEAVRALPSFDWAVVTSPNGARGLRTAAARVPLHTATTRWAAVGMGTAAALRGLGIEPAVRPARATSSALAGELPVGPGSRVLLVRSDIADPALPAALRERGAEVVEIVGYRTIEAPDDSVPMLAAALDEQPLAWIATSPSTVRGSLALADRLGATAVSSVRSLPLVAIGPTTAGAARDLGLIVAVEAAAPTPGDVADAIIAATRIEVPS